MDLSVATPLIEKQGGVVSWRQLRWLGASPTVIRGWRERRWLIPLYRGVYAVGHRALTPHGKRWAAILAGGKGTVLCQRSAGAALDFWPGGSVMHVISPKRIDQPGLRGHRHRLHPGETTKTDAGVPVTTPARTLLDLADVLTPRQLERAYDRARLNRLVSLGEIDRVLANANGRHGAPKLRAIADADRPVNATANDFEDALLALIRANGLPEPEINHRSQDGRQVDFRWPAHRLIVEADGGQHERPAQSRADKRRDAENLTRGWRTVRFSYRDVMEDPAYVVGVLRQLLT
jgi:very-short-patch-repair endonuclease